MLRETAGDDLSEVLGYLAFAHEGLGEFDEAADMYGVFESPPLPLTAHPLASPETNGSLPRKGFLQLPPYGGTGRKER